MRRGKEKGREAFTNVRFLVKDLSLISEVKCETVSLKFVHTIFPDISKLLHFLSITLNTG